MPIACVANRRPAAAAPVLDDDGGAVPRHLPQGFHEEVPVKGIDVAMRSFFGYPLSQVCCGRVM
jgi:hypothetical protein